jgi:hypothetical protein
MGKIARFCILTISFLGREFRTEWQQTLQKGAIFCARLCDACPPVGSATILLAVQEMWRRRMQSLTNNETKKKRR